jgi:hypothetical protein
MVQEEQPIDIVPPEKIAFIAYNIGVYESVQKFAKYPYSRYPDYNLNFYFVIYIVVVVII